MTRIITKAAVIALACCGSSICHAQNDPIATIKGLGQTLKALGGIGRKPVPSGEHDQTGDPRASRNEPSPDADVNGRGEGDTSLSRSALVKGSPSSFDIGGMKLGMSPAEVLRIAHARNLRLEGPLGTNNHSFDDLVAIKVDQLRGRLPRDRPTGRTSGMRLVDAQGSKWDLLFQPVPTGQSVYRIDYETPWAGRTPKSFYDALIAKYGPALGDRNPSTTYFNMAWCGTDRGCSANVPTLRADADDRRVRLKLDEGAVAYVRIEKAITDRAQALLAPNAPKTSF